MCFSICVYTQVGGASGPTGRQAIGRPYNFMEDVSEDVRFHLEFLADAQLIESEDVRFDWEFLADVDFIKEIEFIHRFVFYFNVCQEFPSKTYVFRNIFQEFI